MRLFSVKSIDGATVYINVEKISMVCSTKGSYRSELDRNVVAPMVNSFMPESERRKMPIQPGKDITEIYVSGNVVQTYVPVEDILKKLKEL